MPTIIVLPITATVPGLVTIPITVPPTPVPELWTGLQGWFSPDWDGSFQAGQYAADHSNPALQSKHFLRFNDASGLFGATGPDGDSFMRRLSAFSLDNLWYRIGTTGSDLVNGRKTLIPLYHQVDLYLSNEPTETGKAAALSTSDYTIALVFRTDSGAKGGLLGAGRHLSAAASNLVGWRFGWSDSGEAGTTLWQHSYNDQWNMPVDTATGQPVVVVLSGSGTAADAWVKSGGIETSLTHTFSAARVLPAGYLTATFGCPTDNTGACVARKTALVGLWNRRITGADLTYLKSWLVSAYGPF